MHTNCLEGAQLLESRFAVDQLVDILCIGGTPRRQLERRERNRNGHTRAS